MFVHLGIAMDVTVIFIGGSVCQHQPEAGGEVSGLSPGAEASFRIVGQPTEVKRVATEISRLAQRVSWAEESEVSATGQAAAAWAVTAPTVRDDSLDAQLIWLASELSPYSAFLRSVTHEFAPLVRCVLRSDRDIADQSLSPEGLSFLTSLGIPLELEVCLVASY